MNTPNARLLAPRRRTFAVGLTLAAALAGTLAIPGVASAANPLHVHDLVLTGRYADGTFHFVGKNANDPQIGDEFIDSGPLRARGIVVGQLIDVCQLVAGTDQSNELTHCTGSVTLPGGQLVTTGTENGSDDTTDAITGGTGRYAYSIGTIETISGATSARIVVRFITLQ